MQEFFTYLRVLKKRWWLFLIVCGATLGTIVIGSSTGASQYEATVRFLVNAPPLNDVTLYPGLDRPTRNEQIASTQAAFMEMLKSSTVIRRTLDNLPIDIRLSEFSQGITAEKPPESEFVWVSVRTHDPQQAADLANGLVQTARDYYGQLLAAPSGSAREFISAQVEDALKGLQAAKQALADFQSSHAIGDLVAEIESQRAIIRALILESSKAIAEQNSSGVAAYDRLIAQHRIELQRLGALSNEYDALRDNIRRAEDYYDFLVGKETEAKLKEYEVLRSDFIQVIEPASPPNQPLSRFDAKLFALGVVLSVVSSTVLAFALEYIEARQPHRAKDVAVTSTSQL